MSFFMANWAKQSIRLLKHELKRGELTIIVLAIVLGVASVFSLAGFSGKIKQALLNESTSFIAADRVLQTSRKLADQENIAQPTALWRDAITEKSQQLNINQAQQVLMSSMVFAGDRAIIKPQQPLMVPSAQSYSYQSHKIEQRRQRATLVRLCQHVYRVL